MNVSQLRKFIHCLNFPYYLSLQQTLLVPTREQIRTAKEHPPAHFIIGWQRIHLSTAPECHRVTVQRSNATTFHATTTSVAGFHTASTIRRQRGSVQRQRQQRQQRPFSIAHSHNAGDLVSSASPEHRPVLFAGKTQPFAFSEPCCLNALFEKNPSFKRRRNGYVGVVLTLFDRENSTSSAYVSQS